MRGKRIEGLTGPATIIDVVIAVEEFQRPNGELLYLPTTHYLVKYDDLDANDDELELVDMTWFVMCFKFID